MVLDTAVKPVYNVTADDEDASVIDIQWNVYVVLLLRRYNLITVRSMVYENKDDSYKIHVEINNDDLRQETDNAPAVISSIRDKEAKGFEREIKRMIRGIEHNENLCWSLTHITWFLLIAVGAENITIRKLWKLESSRCFCL